MPIFAPIQRTGLGALPSVDVMALYDGEAGTAQTVEKIKELVDQGVKDPAINRLALWILEQYRVRPYDFPGEARALYDWTMKNLRFRRDMMVGNVGKETLRSAREILEVRAGDCDDINAIFLPSLLGTVGHRVRLVTIAAIPWAPQTFSHIYAEVLLGGKWIPVDAARRDARFGLGPQKYFRKRVWSLSSGQYQDIRGLIGGLGYYAPLGQAYDPRARYLTGWPGLGFSWEVFGNVASSISQGAASLITAIKQPKAYLPPAGAAPSPYVAPQMRATPSLPPGPAPPTVSTDKTEVTIPYVTQPGMQQYLLYGAIAFLGIALLFGRKK